MDDVSRGRSAGPVVPEDRSEVEASAAGEDAAEGPLCPAQPGEYSSALSPSLLTGAEVKGQEARDRAAEQGADVLAWDLLTGLKELLQKLDGGEAMDTSRDLTRAPEESAPGFRPPSPVQVGSGMGSQQVTGSVAAGAEESKGGGVVILADVWPAEPLGAHLKPEVKEKIWKGEYVEIFSLLPLEKFNLDLANPEETSKYPLIPRTFSNWLQAYAILASVIGEKEPENCSALFCYLDTIAEANRVYGGVAWLRYDEQFRQRKAVRPAIRWNHKDICLWMKLMTPARVGNQFFPSGAGGSSTSGTSASKKKGLCWQFNAGSCRYGGTCRFKHLCSGCGGNHSFSRCFKSGKSEGGSFPQ